MRAPFSYCLLCVFALGVRLLGSQVTLVSSVVDIQDVLQTHLVELLHNAVPIVHGQLANDDLVHLGIGVGGDLGVCVDNFFLLIGGQLQTGGQDSADIGTFCPQQSIFPTPVRQAGLLCVPLQQGDDGGTELCGMRQVALTLVGSHFPQLRLAVNIVKVFAFDTENGNGIEFGIVGAVKPLQNALDVLAGGGEADAGVGNGVVFVGLIEAHVAEV